ncbi:MAG: hypothetical protein SPJ74_05400 [Bacilli bacterium]|nr:hypothetical protein [Bacilli bacterium]
MIDNNIDRLKMDENGKKNIKSNNKKIIILFMLIPIILIVEVLCFTGYRNYVSKRNADNNSKESYNEKKKILRKYIIKLLKYLILVLTIIVV